MCVRGGGGGAGGGGGSEGGIHRTHSFEVVQFVSQVLHSSLDLHQSATGSLQLLVGLVTSFLLLRQVGLKLLQHHLSTIEKSNTIGPQDATSIIPGPSLQSNDLAGRISSQNSVLFFFLFIFDRVLCKK